MPGDLRMSEFLVSIFGLRLAEASTEDLGGHRFARGFGLFLGYALNHGSICTAIATTELILEKRPARFIACSAGKCAVWAALVCAIFETST